MDEKWIIGNPKVAGWYFAASRTNDAQECYHVQELWFNPQSTDKWWSGCCWGNGPRCTAVWDLKVVAHMSLPTFSIANTCRECQEPYPGACPKHS